MLYFLDIWKTTSISQNNKLSSILYFKDSEMCVTQQLAVPCSHRFLFYTSAQVKLNCMSTCMTISFGVDEKGVISVKYSK